MSFTQHTTGLPVTNPDACVTNTCVTNLPVTNLPVTDLPVTNLSAAMLGGESNEGSREEGKQESKEASMLGNTANNNTTLLSLAATEGAPATPGPVLGGGEDANESFDGIGAGQSAEEVGKEDGAWNWKGKEEMARVARRVATPARCKGTEEAEDGVVPAAGKGLRMQVKVSRIESKVVQLTQPKSPVLRTGMRRGERRV